MVFTVKIVTNLICLNENILYLFCFANLDAIQKTCHKKHMEILVYQDLADQFQIKLNDLFINEIKNPNYCKLKSLNESHSVFQIPYEKCGNKL